jgi:hypothetical protein
MLCHEVTPELAASWKETADHYRPRLKPNKKTGSELMAYLQQTYPVTEAFSPEIQQIIKDNILKNEWDARKLPAGRQPEVKGFFLENSGAGKNLYETQDEVFRGIRILIGIDLETAFFLVEGSSRLWDELFAFRGLDKDDISNSYLVAEYVSCLKRFGMLDRTLSSGF